MIREMFEEEDLPEEEYEDFKEGLLDELFGDDAEMMGVAIITNFDGQYPMKIEMEDGTLTTSVSKYVREHIKYGFVPSGFSIGYKGYVRADGENKGMIQFFNEDDKSKTGRSDWYITLIPSNVEIISADGEESQENMIGNKIEISEGIRLKQKYGRKYVNWETGEIKYYSGDVIVNKWIEVTPFFSGQYSNGMEIVVDRTIKGAVKLLSEMGFAVKDVTKTSFEIVSPVPQVISLLKNMRMFIVSGNKVSY